MRAFLMIIAVLCVLGALLLIAPIRDSIASVIDRARYHVMIRHVVACTEEKNATICARPLVRAMLENRSGTEVMNSLAPVLDAQQCHYIGHVVGQQLQIMVGNIETAISQCDRRCDSACVHGIIGEAFAEGLGMGSPEEAADLDLSHLGPDEVQRIGKALCTSPETCHGVGHALYQAYEEFEPALTVCRLIAKPETVSFCQQAVFMEYADILYSRNMRAVDNTSLPSVSELRGLCPGQSGVLERRSCFRYFPRMVISTLTAAGSTTREARTALRSMCRSYESLDERINCTIGIGVYSSYALVEDTQRAINVCLAFPDAGDQAACNFGEVSVATRDRQKETIRFCKAVPDQTLRGDCFHAVFYFLNRLGENIPDALRLCEGEDLCLVRAQDYLSDPSDGIKAHYRL